MGGSPVSPPAHSLLVAEQGLTPSWPPGPSSQPWAPAAAGPQAGVGRAEALQAFRQLMLKEMPSQVRFCPQKPFPCSAGSGTQAGAGRRRRHQLVLPPWRAGGCFWRERLTHSPDATAALGDTVTSLWQGKVPWRLFFPGSVCRRPAVTRTPDLLLIFSGGQASLTQT